MLKVRAAGKTWRWSRADNLWLSDDNDQLTNAEMNKLKWR